MFKDIADIIARQLNVPLVSKPSADTDEHFGWMALFASMDVPSSCERTRTLLGWRPTQPGLLNDISKPGYYAA